MEATDEEIRVGTFLLVADIQSLFTDIWHELILKATEYWNEQLQYKINDAERFIKNFI